MKTLINDLKKAGCQIKGACPTRMPEKTSVVFTSSLQLPCPAVYNWQVKNFHLEPQSPLATEESERD